MNRSILSTGIVCGLLLASSGTASAQLGGLRLPAPKLPSNPQPKFPAPKPSTSLPRFPAPKPSPTPTLPVTKLPHYPLPGSPKPMPLPGADKLIREFGKATPKPVTLPHVPHPPVKIDLPKGGVDKIKKKASENDPHIERRYPEKARPQAGGDSSSDRTGGDSGGSPDGDKRIGNLELRKPSK